MKSHGQNQMQSVQVAVTAREGQQAIDPVCGMTVNKQTAAGSTAHNGQAYIVWNNSAPTQDAFSETQNHKPRVPAKRSSRR